MTFWRAAGRLATRFARLAGPAVAATVLLGGCALLKAPEPERVVPEGAPRVEIVAPPELKTLLERYLDLSRLGTLSSTEVVSATEWSRLIAAAPAQVRDLLQTEGYFAPEVEIVREGVVDGVPRKVRLELDPGPRARVDRVDFQFSGDLERDAEAGIPAAVAARNAARAAWPLRVGEPFRDAAWGDAKNGSIARLRGIGYAAATWAGTSAEVDAQNHTVHLFVVADSGPLFRAGKLRVEGLATHEVTVVENLSTLRPGTPVTDALILDFQERLLKTGLFENILITLDTDPEQADAADLLVRLREQPLQVWTVGVGIAANTGPRATLEHLYRHVFGYPLTAHNKFNLSKPLQEWNGEISTRPDANLYRNLLGGSVQRQVTDNDTVLSQSLRLGRTQDMQRIERLYYVEFQRAARTTDTASTEALSLTVNYNGIWRDLDNLLLPTSGYTLSVETGLGHAHSTTTASGPFLRLYARGTGYLPLGRDWFSISRLELGNVFEQRDIAVPDPQLFRAGGADSVRGYSYRSLGPIVDGAVAGGKALATASVEVATPLTARLPTLWGALFVDAGDAANSYGDLRPALGIGAGLRWRSPVGPLRLDLGWGEQTRTFRTYLSVGIAL